MGNSALHSTYFKSALSIPVQAACAGCAGCGGVSGFVAPTQGITTDSRPTTLIAAGELSAAGDSVALHSRTDCREGIRVAISGDGVSQC